MHLIAHQFILQLKEYCISIDDEMKLLNLIFQAIKVRTEIILFI